MKHTTKIKLYNSFFDKNNNLSIKSILNIFQDVASIHGEEIGLGYETMLNKNLYWVLTRSKIDILKMPKINQTVIVETWPHEKGRIDFDRDLKIMSEEGEDLVIGTSKWCVINATTRKLERTDNIFYNGTPILNKNYSDKFNKIILPNCIPEFKFSYIVQFSDLDHNIHMNNTNYSTLVINSTKNKTPKHFEINFISECLEHDIIDILHTSNNNTEFVIGKVDDNVVFVSLIN